MIPTVTVTDDAWRDMLRGFFHFLLHNGSADKFKARLRNETGSFANVRCVNNNFVVKHAGQECQVRPASVALAILRAGQAVIPQGQTLEVFRTDAELIGRIAANATGNHRPQSHSARVPTAPGQPVRG